MNEELRRELISILRAMKDGAPDAFNELVQQRSTYCAVIAITLIAVALIVASVSAIAIRVGFKSNGDKVERDSCLLLGGFMCLLAIVVLGFGLGPLAEAFAPLGRVLEALR